MLKTYFGGGAGYAISGILLVVMGGSLSAQAADNCRRVDFSGPNPVFYLDKACVKARKTPKPRNVAGGKPSKKAVKAVASATKKQPSVAKRSNIVRDPKIRSIQRGLNRKGYAAGPADGIMGQKTKTAILKYYRDRKLKNNSTIIDTVHLDLQGKLPTGNPKIWHLQKRLAAKGHKVGPATGKLDKKTRAAILAYSKKHKLADKYGSTIDKVSAHVAGKPLPGKPAMRSASKTSSSGAGETKVAQLQKLLGKAGYNVGTSGKLDRKTRMGIMSYYKKRKLQNGKGTIMDKVLNDLKRVRS